MTETTRNNKPKQAAKPIAAHPMFPAVTALWFATFFGLGSFALAPSLLEGPVVALGIPDIFPPARPPLGFTVRALTALVMFGLGGAIGLMAGRMLARGKVQAPVRNRGVGQASVRKAAVYSAHEEAALPDTADSVGADASATRFEANHRRPLNPREDLDLLDEIAGPFAAPAAGAMAADDALVLDDRHTAPVSAHENAAPAFTVDDLLPWERDAQALQQTLRNAVQPQMSHNPGSKADPLDLDALMHAAHGDSAQTEPAPQGPIGVPTASAPAPKPVEDTAAQTVEAEPAPAVPTAAPLMAKPLFQAPADAATPIARAPLDKLGLVQLTERLALAIATAKQRPAAAVQAEPVFAPALAEVPSRGLDDAGAHAGMPTAPVAPEAAPAQPEEYAPVQPEASAQPAFTIAAPAVLPAAGIARLPGHAGGLTAFTQSEGEPAHDADGRVVPLRPAAMQPLSLVDDLQHADEDDALPGLDRFLRVPDGASTSFSPLSVKPAKLREQAPAARDEVGEAEEPAEATEAGDAWDAGTAEPDVAEDRYPSLLDVGLASLRHKTTAMMTAEENGDAAEAGEAAEPVVVFPGEADGEASFSQAGIAGPGAARPFERPSILAVQGSPLAAPGKAAPASPLDPLMSQPVDPFGDHAVPAPASLQPDPEEADRALRAALATLQRMTAQG
ncbi:MAG: hypothetical protein ACK40C_13510 [Novosphingobium meiothermophilum]